VSVSTTVLSATIQATEISDIKRKTESQSAYLHFLPTKTKKTVNLILAGTPQYTSDIPTRSRTIELMGTILTKQPEVGIYAIAG